MANYTTADVKRLRELTAAGMMDCKKALEETDGDFDKAVEYLRVKGLKGVTKREGRSASNGLVTAQIADDNSKGTLLELNCETDFVAKGERFQQVAAELLAHAAATGPAEVPALLASSFPASGKTVQEFVDEANATLGEKIELRRFADFEGGYVAAYLHKTSPDLFSCVLRVGRHRPGGRESCRAGARPAGPKPRPHDPLHAAGKHFSSTLLPAGVVENWEV